LSAQDEDFTRDVLKNFRFQIFTDWQIYDKTKQRWFCLTIIFSSVRYRTEQTMCLCGALHKLPTQ